MDLFQDPSASLGITPFGLNGGVFRHRDTEFFAVYRGFSIHFLCALPLKLFQLCGLKIDPSTTLGMTVEALNSW
jgi:hypothetical protein